jgi:hypothetical protein
MEIVINRCFGGFSLSPLAIKELAKLKGKECYFFKCKIFSNKEYEMISLEEAQKELVFLSYSVSNPQDYKLNKPDKNGLYKSANKRAEKISLESSPEDRTDKDLIKVVKKLGKKANGRFANLKIIKIPDGIEWEITEYDGLEIVEEEHKSWK